LRPFCKSAAEALFSIFSDTRVTRNLNRPAWSSIASAHVRISQDTKADASGGCLRFGIELSSSEKLVGECSLFSLEPEPQRAEIGYTLGFDPWSHGYTNEALVCLLDFGFSKLSLNRVEADIDPRNRASAKSLGRLGFKEEGRLRERWIVNGEVSDTAYYGLLSSEWRTTQRNGQSTET
jgi:RimJ/RimL family protein N-acetyltransferase